MPAFHAWVVGGSEAERSFLQNLPNLLPPLGALAAQGRWMAWGRVEATAMAELYSRATATVVPSHFEQFGLVAVEAMACGCPVVACAVGGLAETVIPGITGELFSVDDAASLANILSTYLRNPQKRAWQGANAYGWAQAFDCRRVYEELYRIVGGAAATPAADAANEERWRTQIVDVQRSAIEQLIDSEISTWRDVSDRSQTSIKLETADRLLFAKIIRPRPPSLTMQVGMSAGLRPPFDPAEIVARYRLLRDADFVTPLVAASDNGIVVTAWCEPSPMAANAAGLETWRQLSADFAAFGRRVADPALLANCEAALAAFANSPSPLALAAADEAAADLNPILSGGARRLQKTHPQIELWRLRYALESNSWALPPGTVQRLLSAAVLFTDGIGFIQGAVELCHGSLKPEHVLLHKGRLVTCDLDNMTFAVGALDVVHWLYSDGRLFGGVPFPDALKTLREFVPDSEGLRLALGWLVVYIAYRAVDRHLRGEIREAERYTQYLSGIYETAMGLAITP